MKTPVQKNTSDQKPLTSKTAPAKKPSMENTGTGKNNPLPKSEKDEDVEQYKDLDSSKETIPQTESDSDNVGKEIDYK